MKTSFSMFIYDDRYKFYLLYSFRFLLALFVKFHKDCNLSNIKVYSEITIIRRDEKKKNYTIASKI